jgi:hypothetical protein
VWALRLEEDNRERAEAGIEIALEGNRGEEEEELEEDEDMDVDDGGGNGACPFMRRSAKWGARKWGSLCL